MSKNETKLTTKVSSLISGQSPDFVQADHPLFVKFLKDYYRFLEAGRLTVTATIQNIVQETVSTNYILQEDGEREKILRAFNSRDGTMYMVVENGLMLLETHQMTKSMQYIKWERNPHLNNLCQKTIDHPKHNF